ncbi:Phosphoethanolamine transferase EptA specific for the 1 phosphate group of core-lipid A [Salmonella enterica subsp. enterica]|nr:Phosphoethanolamine transferase EptA specific for the 1 phosphate group of core-lipid A [Salmonella enterica subsp. enterica]
MLKRFLKRPVLGQIAWLLLFSFYIAVCLNIAFYKQVLQDLPLNSLRNVLVFISMPVVAFSVVNSVLTLASFIWLNRLLACVFILVGAAAQYFILTYGIIIDRSMIANMMDTTPAGNLCADDAANGADAGIKRRSGSRDCLLGQNPSGDAALT